MKKTYKPKVTEPTETKFGALATPDAFMGRPVDIFYDPEDDVFFHRYGPVGLTYAEFDKGTFWFITTINPVTDAYRKQRVAEIEKMYREHWASCT